MPCFVHLTEICFAYMEWQVTFKLLCVSRSLRSFKACIPKKDGEDCVKLPL